LKPKLGDLVILPFLGPNHDLPIGARTEKVAKFIRNLVGTYAKWDGGGEICFGRRMCIKVSIDVRKPPRKGMMVKLGDKLA